MDMTATFRRAAFFVAILALVGGGALAGDAPAMSEEEQAAMAAWQKAMTPGPQHAEMAKMVGEFKLTVKSYMDPGSEPQVSSGTASRKMILGGRYLEETVNGTVMDQPFEGRGVTGYDNVAGQWWGSWIDSMSTGLMTSYGEWDDEAGIGTFHGEYIEPMTGEVQETRTVIRRLDGGDELMEMYMITPAGEAKSMEILYERQ
jgi:hypothetical protein